MSNSSMVTYKKPSPNNSGKRTEKISRITPHCVVGHLTVQALGSWFYKSSTQASSNYGIDDAGNVGMYVEENKRSWCSSSGANDQRAVTIECASDTYAPYAMSDTVYKTLVKLCADICKRNGKTEVIWISNKEKALAYKLKSNEMLLTVHRWFSSTQCPGDWLYSRMDQLAKDINKKLAPDQYRVDVGTYKKKADAEKAVDDLKGKGYKNAKITKV